MTSKREWEPGDVAMVTTNYGGPCVALREKADVWICEHGKSIDARVIEVRPLVVIDPEDREQVERLAEAYRATWRGGAHSTEATAGIVVRQMQAALREFADPTPPKPDEPTGRYAVVEDSSAVEWVRADDIGYFKWHSIEGEKSRWADYDEIDAVRVLSRGAVS